MVRVIALNIFMLLALFNAMLLFSACNKITYDINIEHSYNEFSENHHLSDEVEAEVGDIIRMRLCSNPATGFKWDCESSVKNVIRELPTD